MLAMAGSVLDVCACLSGVREQDLAGDQRGGDPREIMRASGQFMGHGLQLALSVLLFLGGGAWLDSKLNTAPFLMLLGAFVGACAGFYSLYYHIVIEPKMRANDPTDDSHE
jgi:F0F1-type ATP synthase assembly protein I